MCCSGEVDAGKRKAGGEGKVLGVGFSGREGVKGDKVKQVKGKGKGRGGCGKDVGG